MGGGGISASPSKDGQYVLMRGRKDGACCEEDGNDGDFAVTRAAVSNLPLNRTGSWQRGSPVRLPICLPGQFACFNPPSPSLHQTIPLIKQGINLPPLSCYPVTRSDASFAVTVFYRAALKSAKASFSTLLCRHSHA